MLNKKTFYREKGIQKCEVWERHEHKKTRLHFWETERIGLRRFKVLNEVK